jgi:hypothetical protein
MDVAYGMMSNLRGRLIQTTTSDPDVWCVASVDGTDARAMPDDGRLRLVSFLFNDHREPAKVKISVAAPEGTTIGTGTVEEVTVDAAWKVGVKTTAVAAKGNIFEAEVVVPGRRGWKVSFPLDGRITEGQQVLRCQVFAPDILKEVAPGKVFETAVAIAELQTKGAKRAWLRMVVEDVAPGEGWVEAGGTRIELPACSTADNGNRILELPLPNLPAAGTLPLRFVVADGPHAGYRVDMVSVVLE